MGMLAVKRRRRNRQVRPRNAPRPGPGDAEVASRCLGVFVWTTDRTGDAYRSGDREDAEHPLRLVSRNEDREGRIRRRNARFPRAPERAAHNDWRSAARG